MVTTRPLQHIIVFTRSRIPTTTRLWFSMYPAKLRIFQNVDLCVLTIHNVVILDIYLYRDYSDINSSYSFKAVPIPITIHQTHGLCHRCAQLLKITNVCGSPLLFKLLSLGSLQNSKQIIKTYNLPLFPPLDPQIKCLGSKAHTLQRYMASIQLKVSLLPYTSSSFSALCRK